MCLIVILSKQHGMGLHTRVHDKQMHAFKVNKYLKRKMLLFGRVYDKELPNMYETLRAATPGQTSE